MCYFSYSPLLSDEKVKIDDAIVAWKVLRLRQNGVLKSPAQFTDWSPEKPMQARVQPSPTNNVGVYAFEHSKDAHGHDQRHDSVVVMLMLWGRVLHFDERPTHTTPATRYKAGYRAQRAEIHEIFLPASLRVGLPSQSFTDTAIDLLVGNWRGHGVKIVRSFPGRRRQTLLAGTEPMGVAA